MWVSDAVRHMKNFWGAREKGNFTSNQIYWELPLHWIFKEKSFDKENVALEILCKSSVLLQLYWNKSISSEIMLDKSITHIVYLSISVLLQPPGMKWMFHIPFQDWSMDDGYMDVSQNWKKNKTAWKHCWKQRNGLGRTVLGYSLRGEVCVLSHYWTKDAPCS